MMFIDHTHSIRYNHKRVLFSGIVEYYRNFIDESFKSNFEL